MGMRYIHPDIFDQGFPYVWDVRACYLNYLKKVREGDILVVGGIINVMYIGVVLENPVFLFPGNAAPRYARCGIAEAADKKILKAFEPLAGEANDVVCIPVAWHISGALCMPRQGRGRFAWLSAEGIRWVNAQLASSGKQEPSRD